METSTQMDDQPERPSLVGQRLGAYRIERLLGQGGMGSVYEAVHEALGQRVAIKLLHEKLAAEGKTIQRFYNEARAISIVQDPGILTIHDFQRLPDGTAYIVMEYLEGEPLHDRLERLHTREQRLPLPHLLQIGRQVAAALCAAHAQGIIHCDLKPDNVYLMRDPPLPFGERAKVLDFGIAKFLTETGGRKTTVGLVLGTPLYMSPEQCEGRERLSDRVDVYALGVILYEMLAGHPPFQAETASALMRQHMMRPLPPLASAAPEAPASIIGLVTRMLAKDPAGRPSMAEVLTGLSALDRQQAVLRPARRRGIVILAGALGATLLLSGVGGLMLRRSKPREARRVAPAAAPAAPVPTVPAAAPAPSSPAPSISTAPAPPDASPVSGPAPAPPGRRRRDRAVKGVQGRAGAPQRGEAPLGATPPAAPPAPADAPTEAAPAPSVAKDTPRPEPPHPPARKQYGAFR